MRKDVECTFGILKGRWQILKTVVRLHGVEQVDKVWLTCCALHNWLLDIDGLDEEWKNGVSTNVWEGDMGQLDFEGVNPSIPDAITRLYGVQDPCNYDNSGMGPGTDVNLAGEGHPISLDYGEECEPR